MSCVSTSFSKLPWSEALDRALRTPRNRSPEVCIAAAVALAEFGPQALGYGDTLAMCLERTRDENAKAVPRRGDRTRPDLDHQGAQLALDESCTNGFLEVDDWQMCAQVPPKTRRSCQRGTY